MTFLNAYTFLKILDINLYVFGVKKNFKVLNFYPYALS